MSLPAAMALSRKFDKSARPCGASAEALERQTATSDVLGVISSSPTDVQRYFALSDIATALKNVRLSKHTGASFRKWHRSDEELSGRAAADTLDGGT